MRMCSWRCVTVSLLKISWTTSNNFCRWLGGRGAHAPYVTLPTEYGCNHAVSRLVSYCYVFFIPAMCMCVSSDVYCLIHSSKPQICQALIDHISIRDSVQMRSMVSHCGTMIIWPSYGHSHLHILACLSACQCFRQLMGQPLITHLRLVYMSSMCVKTQFPYCMFPQPLYALVMQVRGGQVHPPSGSQDNNIHRERQTIWMPSSAEMKLTC